MDQSLQQFFSPLAKAFRQYHTTIVIVVLSVVVGLAVFSLYQVIIVSTQVGVEGYQPTVRTSDSFDQPTIDRVENLRTSNETETPLQFPTRQSPFVE